MPSNYSEASEVLLVIPGAGRNGDEYRDAWIETSELHNILIISPAYPEEMYGFGDYHMGGMITNITYDKDFIFDRNDQPDQWLYNDFDRIFLSLKRALNFETNQYDIFGHSAGGQILNRLTLFYNSPYIDRIVASNAGWYTTIDQQLGLPYGIKNTLCDSVQLRRSFQKRLTLLIGEMDNASETRGTLQKSELAMRQGAHRLARAKSFFEQSKIVAQKMDVPASWEFVIVPNVGHDFRKMSIAASKYLYDTKD